MLEDIEGIEKIPEALSETEGITPSQTEYLAELNVEASDWEDRNEVQQYIMSAVDGRMDELGIDVSQRSELAHSTFSDELAEAYDDFILECYGDGDTDCEELDRQLEAPQDFRQIEQISDVLTNCEELRYENWTSLEFEEKLDLLNNLEREIAQIEHRNPCEISFDANHGSLEIQDGQVCGWMGGYHPITKDITLNADFFTNDNPLVYRELIDTLVHEGRHAYQDYNVNVAEIHPRHSEVASWAENMEGGKWGYWGDCSTMVGQRLYEQQPIEVDARNFAADVLDKLNLSA